MEEGDKKRTEAVTNERIIFLAFFSIVARSGDYEQFFSCSSLGNGDDDMERIPALFLRCCRLPLIAKLESLVRTNANVAVGANTEIAREKIENRILLRIYFL